MMKIRLEITDEDGVKTSVEAEGDIKSSKIADKIIKFMQDAGIPVHHVSGSSSPPNFHIEEDVNERFLTLKDRLRLFLKYDLKKTWFTSSDVKSGYETSYETEIALSTVSTYLARLYREGFLKRRGTRRQLEYCLKHERPEEKELGISVDDANTAGEFRG